MDARSFCPGSKGLREPTPEEVACPRCGASVEIWSDESRRKCPACGMLVTRGRDGGLACAEWCAAARKCLGDDLYERWRRSRGGDAATT
jgi:hypothetical protein